MIRNFVLFISMICFLTHCGAKKTGSNVPDSDALFWGQNPKKTEEKMADFGWKKLSQSGEQILLHIPAEALDNEKLLGFPEGSADHSLSTLFAQDNKLVIVKFFHRNSNEKTDVFLNDFVKKYKIKNPIWESGKRTYSTSNNNKISENTQIFSITNAFVVLHKTNIKISEKINKKSLELVDLQQAEIEIRILNKQYNKGLTQKALIESVKSGLK